LFTNLLLNQVCAVLIDDLSFFG